MVQRFRETVSNQPQDLSTGFVQGTNTLLNRLQGFGRATESAIIAGVKQQQAQAGMDEAKADIAAGKDFTQKKASPAEAILAGGIKTKQYNQAMQTAYLSGLSNDMREALSAIEVENADNITQFNEKAQGYISGVMKEADPAVRAEVATYADNLLTNSRMRVHESTIKKNKANAAAETATAIEGFSNEAYTLSRTGDQIGAAEQMAAAFTSIDSLVESGDMGIDKATRLKREIERESSEQFKRKEFDDLFESEGAQAAFNRLDEASKEPAKGWTPDEWDSFTASVQADLRQRVIRVGQEEVKANAENSIEVSNLKIQANTGFNPDGQRVDDGQIIADTNRMFADGLINANTRASMITSVINRQKKDVKDAVSIEKVVNKLDGAAEIPLEQSEVDYAWDNAFSGVTTELTPEQAAAYTADFVNSTKIVPSAVVKQNK